MSTLPDQSKILTPNTHSCNEQNDVVIRLLNADNAAQFRALRFVMLADTPSAFGSSAEDEINFTLDTWRARIGPDDDTAVVGAFMGDELVGSCAMFRQKPAKMRHQGLIWGVFVNKQARGKGVARKLLEALLDHASTMPNLRQLTLAVTASNESAYALYASLGFTTFGIEPDSLCINDQYHAVKQMVKRIDGNATS